MNTQEYIEVSLEIKPYSDENSDILIAEMAELPFESFSQEPPFVKCYIQKELYDAQMLKLVLSGLAYDFEVSHSATLIPAVNWNAEWESNFPPIVVDGKCTIKAPFHKDMKRTRFNITIEPKMAFGTGHHQTTYLMCRAFLRNEAAIRDKVVLDMGCGTGVLAILAAKMGAKHVYGIDIDVVAAISAYENAAKNRMARRVETYCGDASLLQAGRYEFIGANINRNILLQDIPTYARCLKKGGLLVMSGFYSEDIPAIRERAESVGLIYHGHDTLDNWAGVTFRQPE